MTDSNNTIEEREELAAAFGRDLDPLSEHTSRFEQLDIDAFELFINDVLRPDDPAEATLDSYYRTISHWKNYMQEMGRHPACPNENHVQGFLEYLLTERENHLRTVRKRLRHLNRIYGYWQGDAAFPHPQDFNPFASAREKVNLDAPEQKDYPRLTVADLRERVDRINHVRDYAIVVLQLKLGLRRQEVCNIKLSEIDIQNGEIQAHYDEMGTHQALANRENAIFIPSREERDGNKSQRPRVLPLDGELRRILIRYLLVRPDNSEPWLFLSMGNNTKLGGKTIHRAWETAFHPEYEETEEHRGISSHYGRHFFTTFWRVEQDVNRELIQYMRGDITGQSLGGNALVGAEAIDDYIHTYYEDIEEMYRENIFKVTG